MLSHILSGRFKSQPSLKMYSARMLPLRFFHFKTSRAKFSVHNNLKFPHHFFKFVKEESDQVGSLPEILDFLKDKDFLTKALSCDDQHPIGSYLVEHFVFWLNSYAKNETFDLESYLSGKLSLELICKNFITFCFSQGISLDEKKTLESFAYHNELSDGAVKDELMKISPKSEINLLGFGLDEGYYESMLSNFLIAQGKTSHVNLFGFDPYAKKNPNIRYLSSQKLVSKESPKFDVIVARLVLHHVELKYRLVEFINCVNQCNPNATILVVEHGFSRGKVSFLNEKLNDFLNATFDVIANIGLRPRYFTNTSSEIGANFFIKYLNLSDLSSIKSGIQFPISEKIYDVGPNFPNQTIFCMRAIK